MAGIYLHIPFCRKACTYCDFHFITSLQRKGEMVRAMIEEIHLREAFVAKKEPLETVYFGGGTPSVLEARELEQLLIAIDQTWGIASDAEVSLEANPDDLNPDQLTGWYQAGINRLSLGVQSFDEADLVWMNRSHRALQAVEGIEAAQKAGFRNYSLDLIFGLPGRDLKAWSANLHQALQLNPTHLSLYALTVEEKTALHHQVLKGKVLLPRDERFEEQFLFAHEYLSQEGFEHYELSNYARPGFRSRHNGAYWQGVPYLGIGPSAHSYDGIHRSWNPANNSQYLKALQAGLLPEVEQEELSLVDRYHEYLMTGLRKVEGLDLEYIQESFHMNLMEQHRPYLRQLQDAGHMWHRGQQIGLSPQGWLLSDQIIRELFLTKE